MIRYRVVPHPKLKRDYVGRRVRFVGTGATNGYVHLPPGTIGTIDRQNNKGSHIVCDACTECGAKAIIGAVLPHQIEFIEPQ